MHICGTICLYKKSQATGMHSTRVVVITFVSCINLVKLYLGENFLQIPDRNIFFLNITTKIFNIKKCIKQNDSSGKNRLMQVLLFQYFKKSE